MKKHSPPDHEEHVILGDPRKARTNKNARAKIAKRLRLRDLNPQGVSRNVVEGRRVDGSAMRTIVWVLLNLLVVGQHARLTASANSNTVLHCEGDNFKFHCVVNLSDFHQSLLPAVFASQ